MLLREHTINIELFDIKYTYAKLKQVLEHKLKKEITDGAPKIIWCINEDATRAVVYRIGTDQFSLYTEVAKQAHPQDWAWIDERFGPDDLHHLAKSDAYLGLKHLYAESV
jgi:hypothetical protein